MTKIITYIVAIFAIVFLISGLSWFIAPGIVSQQMGMQLLDGSGLSSQVADMASFFISMGICILFGLKTRNKIWFYPAIMMVVLAAFGRIIAWMVYDADLLIVMISIEIIVSLLLYHTVKNVGK